MRVGLVLKEYRWATRRTVREFAQELGLSEGTLARMERGDGSYGDAVAKVIRWLLEEEVEHA